MTGNSRGIECPHCNGLGRIAPSTKPVERSARGNAAGPAPPFGNDVAQRSRAGCLNWGPDLFVTTDPTTGKDAWQCAREVIEKHGPGSCMVLPPGEPPSRYRWPEIRLPLQESPELVVWGHDYTEEQARAIATELIESSAYKIVDVRGCKGGPFRFRACE